ISTNAYISTSRQPLLASRSVAIVFSVELRDSLAIAVEIVASFNPQEVQNFCCSRFSFPHLGQYMKYASISIDSGEGGGGFEPHPALSASFSIPGTNPLGGRFKSHHFQDRMAAPEVAKCTQDIGLKTVTSLALETAAGSGSRTVGSMAHATPESSGFRMDTSLAQSRVASSTSTKVAFTARIPRSHGLISRLGLARLVAGARGCSAPGLGRPTVFMLTDFASSPFYLPVRRSNAILSR